MTEAQPLKKIRHLKWKKRIHLGWKEGRSIPKFLQKQFHYPLFYKWHYVAMYKGKRYSIIGPSYGTFYLWEAYNGENTPRFNSLKEAKYYCATNRDFPPQTIKSWKTMRRESDRIHKELETYLMNKEGKSNVIDKPSKAIKKS